MSPESIGALARPSAPQQQSRSGKSNRRLCLRALAPSSKSPLETFAGLAGPVEMEIGDLARMIDTKAKEEALKAAAEPSAAVSAKSVPPAPVLIIDQREKDQLPFHRLATRPGTLYSGDYSILGAEELFAVERKTVPDLVSCCCGERDRFKHELHRLRGYRFKRLVIIGSEADILQGNFRSLANPKAILATLHCFEVRYDLPVVFCETPEIAGHRIERWAIWFVRELCKNASRLLEGSQKKSAQPAKAEHPNPDEKPESTDMRIA